MKFVFCISPFIFSADYQIFMNALSLRIKNPFFYPLLQASLACSLRLASARYLGHKRLSNSACQKYASLQNSKPADLIMHACMQI